MKLVGGPADGREVTPTPRDPWAWVDIIGGKLVHYDLRRCEAEQFPDRHPRGGWLEYEQDADNPGIYRYARVTPR